MVTELASTPVAHASLPTRATLQNTCFKKSLKKANIYLRHDPVIPILGIYPRGMKCNRTKINSQMFTATLFIINLNLNTQ